MKDVIKEFLGEIIAVGGTAALAGAGTYIQRKLKNKTTSEKVIEKVADIHDELNRLNTHLKSSRILVIATHNGGGIPKIGEPLYMSVRYEVYDHPSEPVKADWQERLIDGPYSKMLNTIISEGKYSIATEDLDDGSMLKKTYNYLNIKRNFVIPIERTNKNFYYMSVTWMDKNDPVSEEDEYAIEACVSAIKKYFK